MTLVNTATNESRGTITSSVGHYSFPLLPPAVYRIEAEAPGFKRYIRDNIKLEVALTLTLDLNLEVGAITDSVTVTGEAPALEEGSSALGHIIENNRIVNLPTNGRNSYGFATLVPGVRASKGFTQVAYGMYNDQFVSINGSSPNQNSFTLDGGNNTNPAFNGPGYFPSVDEPELPNYVAPHVREPRILVAPQAGSCKCVVTRLETRPRRDRYRPTTRETSAKVEYPWDLAWFR